MDIIQEAKEWLTHKDDCGNYAKKLGVDYKDHSIEYKLISRLVDRLEWKPIDEIEPNTRCILTFNFVDAYTGQLEDDGLWYDGSYGIPTPTHWLPLPPVGDK